jgi:tetratricopeptide (TPR) repeat protein
MRSIVIQLCVAALICCAPIPSLAHEGPEHEIEELTERMKKHGESAELLTERAVEYRVLGKLAEATKDLERAAVLEPGSLAIHRELARVLFLGGKAGEAIAEVARGLKLDAEEPADTAALRMLRAEILRSQNDNKKALEDCDAALKLHKRNPEWYLLRSDIQRRLKAHKERIAGIEDGIRETGAGVLEIERVEALLDAGQFPAALKVIEAELADSRIRSSWLIRRARAFSGTGRKDAAEADLKDALEEIVTRLNPKTPDVPLLLDKALAHELLGEKKDALRAYEEARDKGADGLGEKIKSLQEPGDVTPPAAEKK